MHIFAIGPASFAGNCITKGLLFAIRWFGWPQLHLKRFFLFLLDCVKWFCLHFQIPSWDLLTGFPIMYTSAPGPRSFEIRGLVLSASSCGGSRVHRRGTMPNSRAAIDARMPTAYIRSGVVIRERSISRDFCGQTGTHESRGYSKPFMHGALSVLHSVNRFCHSDMCA